MLDSFKETCFKKEYQKIKKKWEKTDIIQWDFAGLPERIPLKDRDGRLTGFAWPGLVESDGQISLRLFTSQNDAREITKTGLASLYRLHFSRQWKEAKKDFVIPRAHWALYEGLGTHEEINKDIFTFIISEIFQIYSGSIPCKDDFDKCICIVKEHGLYTPGKKILKDVVTLLQQRRSVLDVIGKFEESAKGLNKKACFLFKEQVKELLPPGFLNEITLKELNNFPRYLKAIGIRMERRMTNPAKDAAKEVQLQPHIVQLAEVMRWRNITSELQVAISQYKQMIEEFKVSLFAQELKTAFPVSARRLEEKWREIKVLSIE